MAPAEAAAGALPAGARGATRIADRVVAKIASHAAREALRAFPEAVPQVPAGHTAPHATVSVRRATERTAAERAAGQGAPLGEARVRVAVELGYPSDIGAQCGAVRRTVTERVTTLAGMDVREVAVAVARLHSAHTRASGEGTVR
ncbi:Asp23/Gls24 family envelope stress response protein [Streptomyces sp. H10-C2]|uniref:Asp23/Gls24 family envelope stress response protein n=1 Tax=unclassified Streptomyces TaxID=2593676 RepID=UPI0024B97A28|nr:MULTISPECIES: Asp23/Gls24 family envelope stress response protein [unclassified Streptomyces]MDJ0346770.1 Asp23/Gls24 family envelope stress response protein [Streptomyces sp. PH10-H1]MDJ0374080.1 Asp23/Gls24 family envelope stress response protein [Streptomyces sp. H10-C2]